MRCEQILIELDAYLTGEIDAALGSEIQRHVDVCPSCRRELMLLEKEQALYRDYRATIPVPLDAWGHVRTRMRQAMPGGEETVTGHWPFGQRIWWGWALAASVLLVAGLSWIVVEHRRSSEQAGPGQPAPSFELSPEVDQAVKNYEQALALLEPTYRERKTHLDPELVRDLDWNLDLTRQAISDCERALRENPQDEQMVDFLLLGYEKQLGIFRQITEEL